MPALFALGLAAAIVVAIIVVISVLGFAAHLLFSPWILLAIAIVAWIKLRPRRRTRQ
jgi:uncharacterized membrane protein